jgi:glycosyltransferase involved in cell wall biosynthesis
MNYPKISIVTPNYNQATFLEQTILSVLNQGYPNLEYIIIDGGSTDGSVEIIRKYETQLAYWISEHDGGMYEAIQKGFDKSSGEIMAWINSDDMYHPKALFTVADIFHHIKEVNWLVGADTGYDEMGRTTRIAQSRAFTKFDFWAHDYCWIQQESCFWRRSLWEKVGGSLNTQLHFAGDFDLWLRFFRFEQLYVVNALIGGFRGRRSNQLSLDHLDEYLAEAEEQLKNEPLSETNKRVLKKYERIKFIHNKLKPYKIINADRIIKRFRRIYFPSVKTIEFDRDTQHYYLK